jgi:molecular chaperone Hsp33
VDRLVVYEGSGARLVAVDAARAVAEAVARHGLAAGSAQALANAMCGALLLAAHMETRVDVQLDCLGPLKGVFADADETGAVRGFVKVRDLAKGARLFSEPGAEIAGRLSVVRAGPPLHRTLLPFAGEHYAACLSHVLRVESEQGGSLLLEGSRGALLQPAQDLQLRGSIDDWAKQLELQPVQEVQPRFACRCSRDRIVQALRSLQPQDLLQLADEDGGADCNCDFCGATYRISAEELRSYAIQPA